jgi:hypothetical protein
MIFRAIFWVAVVAAFLPHEPDLSYGRPGDSGEVAAFLRDTLQARIADVKTQLHAADTTAGGKVADGHLAVLARSSRDVLDPFAGFAAKFAQVAPQALGEHVANVIPAGADPIGDKIAKLNTLRAVDSLP